MESDLVCLCETEDPSEYLNQLKQEYLERTHRLEREQQLLEQKILQVEEFLTQEDNNPGPSFNMVDRDVPKIFPKYQDTPTREHENNRPPKVCTEATPEPCGFFQKFKSILSISKCQNTNCNDIPTRENESNEPSSGPLTSEYGTQSVNNKIQNLSRTSSLVCNCDESDISTSKEISESDASCLTCVGSEPKTKHTKSSKAQTRRASEVQLKFSNRQFSKSSHSQTTKSVDRKSPADEIKLCQCDSSFVDNKKLGADIFVSPASVDTKVGPDGEPKRVCSANRSKEEKERSKSCGDPDCPWEQKKTLQMTQESANVSSKEISLRNLSKKDPFDKSQIKSPDFCAVNTCPHQIKRTRSEQVGTQNISQKDTSTEHRPSSANSSAQASTERKTKGVDPHFNNNLHNKSVPSCNLKTCPSRTTSAQCAFVGSPMIRPDDFEQPAVKNETERTSTPQRSKSCDCSVSEKQIFCSKNAASLPTHALDNMKEITGLAAREKVLKEKLNNLKEKEKSYNQTSKMAQEVINQSSCICAPNRNNPLKNNADLESEIKKVSNELKLENNQLKSELMEMKLQLKHTLESIEGPMKQKLNTEKMKCHVLQEELNLASQNLIVSQDTYQQETNSLKMQLCIACSNISELNQMNGRLKNEMKNLDTLCNKLEDDLIKQKLNEAETIKRITARKQHGGGEGPSNSTFRCPSDLADITRQLSKTLKEVPCSQCTNIPQELKGAAKCIKDLADMVLSNRKFGPNSECVCKNAASRGDFQEPESFTGCVCKSMSDIPEEVECDCECCCGNDNGDFELKHKRGFPEEKTVTTLHPAPPDFAEKGASSKFEVNTEHSKFFSATSQPPCADVGVPCLKRSTEKPTDSLLPPRHDMDRPCSKETQSQVKTIQTKSDGDIDKHRDTDKSTKRLDKECTAPCSKDQETATEKEKKIIKELDLKDVKSQFDKTESEETAIKSIVGEIVEKLPLKEDNRLPQQEQILLKEEQSLPKEEQTLPKEEEILLNEEQTLPSENQILTKSDQVLPKDYQPPTGDEGIMERILMEHTESSTAATPTERTNSTEDQVHITSHSMPFDEKRFGSFPFDVTTKVEAIEEPPQGLHVTTTITGSGTLEVITEGPKGLVETTLTYTDDGNIEVVTELVDYKGTKLEDLETKLSKESSHLPPKNIFEGKTEPGDVKLKAMPVDSSMMSGPSAIETPYSASQATANELTSHISSASRQDPLGSSTLTGLVLDSKNLQKSLEKYSPTESTQPKLKSASHLSESFAKASSIKEEFVKKTDPISDTDYGKRGENADELEAGEITGEEILSSELTSHPDIASETATADRTSEKHIEFREPLQLSKELIEKPTELEKPRRTSEEIIEKHTDYEKIPAKEKIVDDAASHEKRSEVETGVAQIDEGQKEGLESIPQISPVHDLAQESEEGTLSLTKPKPCIDVEKSPQTLPSPSVTSPAKKRVDCSCQSKDHKDQSCQCCECKEVGITTSGDKETTTDEGKTMGLSPEDRTHDSDSEFITISETTENALAEDHTKQTELTEDITTQPITEGAVSAETQPEHIGDYLQLQGLLVVSIEDEEPPDNLRAASETSSADIVRAGPSTPKAATTSREREINGKDKSLSQETAYTFDEEVLRIHPELVGKTSKEQQQILKAFAQKVPSQGYIKEYISKKHPELEGKSFDEQKKIMQDLGYEDTDDENLQKVKINENILEKHPELKGKSNEEQQNMLKSLGYQTPLQSSTVKIDKKMARVHPDLIEKSSQEHKAILKDFDYKDPANKEIYKTKIDKDFIEKHPEILNKTSEELEGILKELNYNATHVEKLKKVDKEILEKHPEIVGKSSEEQERFLRELGYKPLAREKVSKINVDSEIIKKHPGLFESLSKEKQTILTPKESREAAEKKIIQKDSQNKAAIKDILNQYPELEGKPLEEQMEHLRKAGVLPEEILPIDTETLKKHLEGKSPEKQKEILEKLSSSRAVSDESREHLKQLLFNLIESPEATKKSPTNDRSSVHDSTQPTRAEYSMGDAAEVQSIDKTSRDIPTSRQTSATCKSICKTASISEASVSAARSTEKSRTVSTQERPRSVEESASCKASCRTISVQGSTPKIKDTALSPKTQIEELVSPRKKGSTTSSSSDDKEKRKKKKQALGEVPSIVSELSDKDLGPVVDRPKGKPRKKRSASKGLSAIKCDCGDICRCIICSPDIMRRRTGACVCSGNQESQRGMPSHTTQPTIIPRLQHSMVPSQPEQMLMMMQQMGYPMMSPDMSTPRGHPRGCTCRECVCDPCTPCPNTPDIPIQGQCNKEKPFRCHAKDCECVDCLTMPKIKKLAHTKEYPIVYDKKQVYQVDCSCENAQNAKAFLRSRIPVPVRSQNQQPVLQPSEIQQPTQQRSATVQPAPSKQMATSPRPDSAGSNISACDCNPCECENCADPSIPRKVPTRKIQCCCEDDRCRCEPCPIEPLVHSKQPSQIRTTPSHPAQAQVSPSQIKSDIHPPDCTCVKCTECPGSHLVKTPSSRTTPGQYPSQMEPTQSRGGPLSQHPSQLGPTQSRGGPPSQHVSQTGPSKSKTGPSEPFVPCECDDPCDCPGEKPIPPTGGEGDIPCECDEPCDCPGERPIPKTKSKGLIKPPDDCECDDPCDCPGLRPPSKGKASGGLIKPPDDCECDDPCDCPGLKPPSKGKASESKMMPKSRSGGLTKPLDDCECVSLSSKEGLKGTPSVTIRPPDDHKSSMDQPLECIPKVPSQVGDGCVDCKCCTICACPGRINLLGKVPSVKSSSHHGGMEPIPEAPGDVPCDCTDCKCDPCADPQKQRPCPDITNCICQPCSDPEIGKVQRPPSQGSKIRMKDSKVIMEQHGDCICDVCKCPEEILGTAEPKESQTGHPPDCNCPVCKCPSQELTQGDHQKENVGVNMPEKVLHPTNCDCAECTCFEDIMKTQDTGHQAGEEFVSAKSSCTDRPHPPDCTCEICKPVTQGTGDFSKRQHPDDCTCDQCVCVPETTRQHSDECVCDTCVCVAEGGDIAHQTSTILSAKPSVAQKASHVSQKQSVISQKPSGVSKGERGANCTCETCLCIDCAGKQPLSVKYVDDNICHCPTCKCDNCSRKQDDKDVAPKPDDKIANDKASEAAEQKEKVTDKVLSAKPSTRIDETQVGEPHVKQPSKTETGTAPKQITPKVSAQTHPIDCDCPICYCERKHSQQQGTQPTPKQSECTCLPCECIDEDVKKEPSGIQPSQKASKMSHPDECTCPICECVEEQTDVGRVPSQKSAGVMPKTPSQKSAGDMQKAPSQKSAGDMKPAPSQQSGMKIQKSTQLVSEKESAVRDGYSFKSLHGMPCDCRMKGQSCTCPVCPRMEEEPTHQQSNVGVCTQSQSKVAASQKSQSAINVGKKSSVRIRDPSGTQIDEQEIGHTTAEGTQVKQEFMSKSTSRTHPDQCICDDCVCAPEGDILPQKSSLKVEPKALSTNKIVSQNSSIKVEPQTPRTHPDECICNVCICKPPSSQILPQKSSLKVGPQASRTQPDNQSTVKIEQKPSMQTKSAHGMDCPCEVCQCGSAGDIKKQPSILAKEPSVKAESTHGMDCTCEICECKLNAVGGIPIGDVSKGDVKREASEVVKQKSREITVKTESTHGMDCICKICECKENVIGVIPIGDVSKSDVKKEPSELVKQYSKGETPAIKDCDCTPCICTPCADIKISQKMPSAQKISSVQKMPSAPKMPSESKIKKMPSSTIKQEIQRQVGEKCRCRNEIQEIMKALDNIRCSCDEAELTMSGGGIKSSHLASQANEIMSTNITNATSGLLTTQASLSAQAQRSMHAQQSTHAQPTYVSAKGAYDTTKGGKMFVKKASDFGQTMSGLKMALQNLQEKCKMKDRMIAAMTGELESRGEDVDYDKVITNAKAIPYLEYDMAGDIKSPERSQFVSNVVITVDNKDMGTEPIRNVSSKAVEVRTHKHRSKKCSKTCDSPMECNLHQIVQKDEVHCKKLDLQFEVVDVRRITEDSLIVKWMAPAVDYVTGYDIFVNGTLASKVMSGTRTSAMMHSLDLSKSVQITIYAVTKCGRCEPPAIAIYEIKEKEGK